MHRAWFSWVTAVGGTTLYGLAVRVIAASRPEELRAYLFGLLTLAFLCAVPFVMGFLCVRLRPQKDYPSALAVSLLPCLLLLGFTFWTGLEGLICIVLAVPPFGVLALLGGGLAHALRLRKDRTDLLPMMALPFVVGLIEGRFPAPNGPRIVHSSIEIEASPSAVWSQIERVPAIRADELQPSLAGLMGFPDPLEATLDREGVGGVRQATFAGGILFIETITEWDEPRRLSFAIDPRTETIPPTTLDEHVTIGGEYFDVLQGTYSIEDRGQGRVVLHLESRLRVSTTLNLYANPWADALMASIQDQILHVVKERTERAVR